MQPNYYPQQPQPQFLPVPPRFAGRFQVGVILTGVVIMFGTVIVYLLTLWASGFLGRPAGAFYLVVGLLPVLGVVALGVTLLTAARCLQGQYLVIARARSTLKALIVCALTSTVLSVFAIFVPLLSDRPINAFSPLECLIMTGVGFASGHFWVRPSVNTLHKFSDRPAW